MADDGVAGARWVVQAGTAVLAHPSLWGVAVSQALRLAPSGWWRRRPFLPVPDPGYLRFRLETQYGSDREPEPADVVTYLRWCRRFAHVRTRAPVRRGRPIGTHRSTRCRRR